MKNWKVRWKQSYDNKIIVSAKIEYLGFSRITLNGESVEVMNFRTRTKTTLKKKYTKEKLYSQYTWSCLPFQGIVKYYSDQRTYSLVNAIRTD